MTSEDDIFGTRAAESDDFLLIIEPSAVCNVCRNPNFETGSRTAREKVIALDLSKMKENLASEKKSREC